MSRQLKTTKRNNSISYIMYNRAIESTIISFFCTIETKWIFFLRRDDFNAELNVIFWIFFIRFFSMLTVLWFSLYFSCFLTIFICFALLSCSFPAPASSSFPFFIHFWTFLTFFYPIWTFLSVLKYSQPFLIIFIFFSTIFDRFHHFQTFLSFLMENFPKVAIGMVFQISWQTIH